MRANKNLNRAAVLAAVVAAMSGTHPDPTTIRERIDRQPLPRYDHGKHAKKKRRK